MELLITFLLGIFILIGALIAKLTKNSKIIEQLSISIAFGTMTALALLELLPEAVENLDSENITALIACVILGVVILKILDLFVPEHHHSHGGEHGCCHGDECCSESSVSHIGVVSSIAVIIHNIIEGMAVYSMAAESIKVGVLMAIGVGLHNIPMGMVICSTLQKDKPRKLVIFLTLATLSTFIGGVLMSLLWSVIDDFVIGMLIGVTLGMIIYIVVFELLPHLMSSKNKWLSCIGMVAGVLIIIISCLIE